jgi:predicted dehydrogenase
MSSPLKALAVVGAGDWGKNLIRTHFQLLGTRLKYVCDLSPERLKKISSTYPTIQTISDYQKILSDPEVDAVVIATTAGTHFELAKKALLADKHVYVEKPMTLRVDEARELVKLSEDKQRTLMVGHILIYHPAVQKLKELIDKNELGNVYYIYSQRLNLGKVRVDENAMWSFAPHDLAVIFYLFNAELDSISASGQSFLSQGVEDVVILILICFQKR